MSLTLHLRNTSPASRRGTLLRLVHIASHSVISPHPSNSSVLFNLGLLWGLPTQPPDQAPPGHRGAASVDASRTAPTYSTAGLPPLHLEPVWATASKMSAPAADDTGGDILLFRSQEGAQIRLHLQCWEDALLC